MADTQSTKPKKSTAKKSGGTKPRKTVAQKKDAKETVPMANTAASTNESTGTDHRSEAKTRFNAAVQEAKAGAAALRAEAGERASAYRSQARDKSGHLVEDAKGYRDEAKVKGTELANEGKHKLSEGIASLGRLVSDNAHRVDEQLGAKYGDYARSASRSLTDTAGKLDQKSIDELAEDGREFVRKSPGLAIGIAAVAGYMLSRLFSGSRR